MILSQKLKELIYGVIAFVCLGLGILNFNSLSQKISLVKQISAQSEDMIPAAFQPSLKLKLQMLRQLQVVTHFFYLPKFILYSIQGFNSENEILSLKLQTAFEFSDMLVFVFLLWIFRPREQFSEPKMD